MKKSECIELVWAKKIRARLNDKCSSYACQTFQEYELVREFIKPILNYADAEEKRITKAFVKEKKDLENRSKLLSMTSGGK